MVEEDPGLMGNLLVERMVGAHVELVSKEEYKQYGSEVNSLFRHRNSFCTVFVPFNVRLN